MTSDNEARVRTSLERRDRDRVRYASYGWHEITDRDEFEPIANRFFSTFFPNSSRRLPVPYVTWDVSHATKDAHSKQQRNLIDDLHRKCLPAIKRCDPNGVWYALENIHHPWYRIHLNETPEHIEDWPIVFLPYADPCYLVAQDFSCGFIADLDRTISIFGARLIAELQQHNPLVFSTMIESTLA